MHAQKARCCHAPGAQKFSSLAVRPRQSADPGAQNFLGQSADPGAQNFLDLVRLLSRARCPEIAVTRPVPRNSRRWLSDPNTRVGAHARTRPLCLNRARSSAPAGTQSSTGSDLELS
jgi:hypothetical protein